MRSTPLKRRSRSSRWRFDSLAMRAITTPTAQPAASSAHCTMTGLDSGACRIASAPARCPFASASARPRVTAAQATAIPAACPRPTNTVTTQTMSAKKPRSAERTPCPVPTASRVMAAQPTQLVASTARRRFSVCAFQRASANTSAIARQAATRPARMRCVRCRGCAATAAAPLRQTRLPIKKKRRVIARVSPWRVSIG